MQGGFDRRQSGFFTEFGDIGGQLDRRYGRHFCIEDGEDKIIWLLKIARQNTNTLIDTATDAVADYGRLTDLATDHDRDTVVAALRILSIAEGKRTGSYRFAVRIQPGDATTTMKPIRASNHIVILQVNGA